MLTPYFLAVLAVILAWPAPLWLQRAKWPSRAPGAALILWQAIGISGGLALVTAPLTWGLQPFGSGIFSAGAELWRTFNAQGFYGLVYDTRWDPLGLAAVTLGCILFGHLTLVLLHTTYLTFSQRKRHREFVDVLSASLHDDAYGSTTPPNCPASTRVLPVEHPLAYCLPAINSPITVVSTGLLNQLSSKQLAAVLAHESAHLTQRHDLLRLAFQAWHKASPWLPATSTAAQEVTELTEILADNVALSQHTRQDLAAAVAHTVGTSAQQNLDDPTRVSPLDPAKPARRVTRLTESLQPLSSCRVSLVIIAAGLLVLVPAVISLI